MYTISPKYETSLKKPFQNDAAHAVPYKLRIFCSYLIFYIYLMPRQLESYILINKQDKHISYSKMPNLAALRNISLAGTFTFLLMFKKVNVYKPNPLLAWISFSLFSYKITSIEKSR